MLLMCGKDDDFTGAGICTGTRKLAEHMTLTPGRAILLQNTGHSLDVEHPNYVVRQIAEFLGI
jgi:pimeloyl-ACP methyl ester carboxylesterase